MDGFSAKYRGIALGTLVFLVVVVGWLIVQPFLPALLWATVLTILTLPLTGRLQKRFDRVKWLKGDRSETVAALVSTLLTLVILLIPFAMVGFGIFLQLGGVTSSLEGNGDKVTFDSVLTQIDASVKPIAQRLGAGDFSVGKYVNENREQLVSSIRQPLTNFVRQGGFTILTIVIALLTQFFMLRDGHRLRQPAIDLSPFDRERTEGLFHRISETVWAVFVGTVLVAIIQGAIIGITYAFVGVPNALLLGVISAVLCIIPLLGAPVVYIPVGLILLAQGKVTEALVILGVGFIIVSNIDNVLKPFLIGGRANLHPVAIFFSILGGVFLFGPIGVMAGPMVLTVLLSVIEVLREMRGESTSVAHA